MGAASIGTRRSAILNKRRKAPAPPWLGRAAYAILTVLTIGWIASMLYATGGVEGLKSWAAEESGAWGFRVDDVLVEGRARADAKTLKTIIGAAKGMPLFKLDPAAIRARVESMDWVRRATVERRLPSTLYIRIEEHTPLALWRRGKTMVLVNEEGGAINEKDLAPFKDLMIVDGADAPAHTPDLLKALDAEPSIKERAIAARWTDGRRWDLVIKPAIIAQLPEEAMDAALARLARAQAKEDIFSKAIVEIDLRAPDRMIVRAKPGAAGAYSGGGKGDPA